MATRPLDRVPLERIEQRARPVDLGHVLMVAVVGLFFALGWLAGRVVVVAGVALGWAGVLLGWAWAAAAEGWDAGRGRPPRAGLA